MTIAALNDSDAMQSGWMYYLYRPTYSCAFALTYLLTYLHGIASVVCD